MKNHVLYILTAMSIICINKINAQQEVNYSLYQYNLNLLNPAATGTQGGAYLNMSVRTQWVGIKDAPETQAISFGTPNKKGRMGTGFSAIRDQAFAETSTQFFADFSYRLSLGGERNLFLGLKAGGTSTLLEASNLKTRNIDIDDPLLENTTGFVPNIGVGFYYKTPTYFLSASIPRLLSTERYAIEGNQVSYATDRPHLFVATGIRFPVSETWDLYPSTMVSVVEGAPIEVIADVSFSFDKKFDFGIQGTSSGGIGIKAFAHLTDTLQLGYTYLTSAQDQVNPYSKGTHEFVLKVKLGGVDEAGRVSSFTNQVKADAAKNERSIGTSNKNKK